MCAWLKCGDIRASKCVIRLDWQQSASHCHEPCVCPISAPRCSVLEGSANRRPSAYVDLAKVTVYMLQWWALHFPPAIFLKQLYVELVSLCDLAPCYKTLYPQHESEAVSLRSESDAAIKIRKCSTIRVSEVGSREAVTHPGAGNMEWKCLFCEVERRMKYTRLLIHLFQWH